MSGRSNDYDKGSSRSARDDSRPYKDRREDKDGRDRRKSRSRSPKRRNSPPASSSNFSPNSSDRHRERSRKDYENRKSHKKSSEWEGSDEEEVPVPPPPPRITKISMGFAKPKIPIKMSLGGPVKTSVAKSTVASVFNNDDDDDDEPEEMPAEARMRMRNIGRETPTSAGPNSFGKTKQGFCDAKKVFEKNLKEQLETVDRPVMTKFPQTIYKIKGP